VASRITEWCKRHSDRSGYITSPSSTLIQHQYIAQWCPFLKEERLSNWPMRNDFEWSGGISTAAHRYLSLCVRWTTFQCYDSWFRASAGRIAGGWRLVVGGVVRLDYSGYLISDAPWPCACRIDTNVLSGQMSHPYRSGNYWHNVVHPLQVVW